MWHDKVSGPLAELVQVPSAVEVGWPTAFAADAVWHEMSISERLIRRALAHMLSKGFGAPVKDHKDAASCHKVKDPQVAVCVCVCCWHATLH